MLWGGCASRQRLDELLDSLQSLESGHSKKLKRVSLANMLALPGHLSMFAELPHHALASAHYHVRIARVCVFWCQLPQVLKDDSEAQLVAVQCSDASELLGPVQFTSSFTSS